MFRMKAGIPLEALRPAGQDLPHPRAAARKALVYPGKNPYPESGHPAPCGKRHAG